MTNATNISSRTHAKPLPDWVVKTPKAFGHKQKLERIGAAWNRADGGLCIRLTGTQVIGDDIYLYPIERRDDHPEQADLLTTSPA